MDRTGGILGPVRPGNEKAALTEMIEQSRSRPLRATIVLAVLFDRPGVRVAFMRSLSTGHRGIVSLAVDRVSS
jgi:hypothetical protein